MPVIIIDTREQEPFERLGRPGWRTRRAKLAYGDYAVAGLARRFAVERKALPDLFGTLAAAAQRARFERELDRATAAGGRLAVVVEAPLSRVLAGSGYSAIRPARMITSLMAMLLPRGHHVHFTSNRAEAEEVTRHLLESVWEARRALWSAQGEENEEGAG